MPWSLQKARDTLMRQVGLTLLNTLPRNRAAVQQFREQM
jgi:hypothetical protein